MPLFSELPTVTKEVEVILDAIHDGSTECTKLGFLHTVTFIEDSRQAASCLSTKLNPALGSAFYDSLFNLVCRKSMNGVCSPANAGEAITMIDHYRSEALANKYAVYNQACFFTDERSLESLFEDLVSAGNLKFTIDSDSGSIYFLRIVFKACFMARYSIADTVELMRLAMKYLFKRPSLGLEEHLLSGET